MQTKIDMGNSPIPLKRVKSLGEILELLQSKSMENSVRDAVIKELSSYPEGSLDFAWININNIISNATNKVSIINNFTKPTKLKEEEND
jgi:hypothetical protein